VSFSVAATTRPSATSGSPYSWPSSVGEVQARREGRSLVRAVSTPVASAFPWYVVQLEPKPETLDRGLDLAAPAVASPTVVAAEPGAEEPQPKQHSDAAVTAAPTATRALTRLRTPRPTPARPAAVLTAQLE
jgi:hypothetical protein